MTKKIVRTLALSGATAALASAALAGSASAAGGCSGAGPVRQEPFSARSHATVFCNTYVKTNVYGQPTTDSSTTGLLFRGRSWFVCQTYGGRNHPIGKAENNVWLFTRADTVRANKGWGWVPAVAISSGNNNELVPGVPLCDRSRAV